MKRSLLKCPLNFWSQDILTTDGCGSEEFFCPLAFLVFIIYNFYLIIFQLFQFYFRVQESMEENQTILSMIKGMINIELMIRPVFLLISISGFLSMLGFFVPLLYLPDMAKGIEGIESSNANFLISIYGK